MRLRNKAREIVRSIPFGDGHVVLIKAGTPLATDKGIDVLGHAIATKFKDCIMVIVNDFDDLSVADEPYMNAHGWFRRE